MYFFRKFKNTALVQNCIIIIKAQLFSAFLRFLLSFSQVFSAVVFWESWKIKNFSGFLRFSQFSSAFLYFKPWENLKKTWKNLKKTEKSWENLRKPEKTWVKSWKINVFSAFLRFPLKFSQVFWVFLYFIHTCSQFFPHGFSDFLKFAQQCFFEKVEK